jgi:hypothetical protein
LTAAATHSRHSWQLPIIDCAAIHWLPTPHGARFGFVVVVEEESAPIERAKRQVMSGGPASSLPVSRQNTAKVRLM